MVKEDIECDVYIREWVGAAEAAAIRQARRRHSQAILLQQWIAMNDGS